MGEQRRAHTSGDLSGVFLKDKPELKSGKNRKYEDHQKLR